MKDIYEQNIQAGNHHGGDEEDSMDELSELEKDEEIREVEADFRANSNVHTEKLHFM
jgi:hypothetical protein